MGSMNVFSDDSKTKRGTGAEIHCAEMGLEISIPLGNPATVLQAETFLIRECCEVLTQRRPQGQSIVTCSDSKAALSARSVFDGRLALENLSERSDVTLAWVPGRTGEKK